MVKNRYPKGKKHALVIGGSGMLSKVSIWLANQGYHVSVIGRNKEKMQRLEDQIDNPLQMTPVLVDYTKNDELADKLRTIQQKNGSIELAVAWIHSNGENVIPTLKNAIPHSVSWGLFHVNGSSANLVEIKEKISVLPNMEYYQIQLGFIVENNHSRWLTHEEISAGVIEAIRKKKSVHLVGTLEPWNKRP